MSNEKWINSDALFQEFGIAKSTQAKYRSEKSIPYTKIGGFIFYSREKIYAWLEKHSFDTQE